MRILSVDGGGYLGLAAASFLSGIEHHFNAKCAEQFDLFCGTSTGSIIALALATGMSADQVTSLYEELGSQVFPPSNRMGRFRRQFMSLFGARHDDAPLKSALERAFGDTTVGNVRESGKKLLVTAWSLTSGRPKVFKTDHAEELSAHDGYLLRDIALASCAAPTYLPVVPLVDPVSQVMERFCDGGVAANSPALLGYAEAVSALRCSPTDVLLLSIATPRTDLSEPTSALSRSRLSPNRGLKDWGYGVGLMAVAIDGPMQLNDTALERIAKAGGSLYRRIAFPRPGGLGLDVVTAGSTETLKQIGAERSRDTVVRTSLQPFFA
jgi:hypothetical protein